MFGVYYVYWGVIPYWDVLGVGEFYDMYAGSLPTFLANIALSPSYMVTLCFYANPFSAKKHFFQIPILLALKPLLIFSTENLKFLQGLDLI